MQKTTSKLKSLIALKKAYREFPAVLSDPILMAGMEYLLQSAIRYPGSKSTYHASVQSIHAELHSLISEEKLYTDYKIGHTGKPANPKSNREEVFAIGLYNTLYMKLDPAETNRCEVLPGFRVLDYQIPVVKGKEGGIGCIDLFGICEGENGEYRPVIVELKGQVQDTDKDRRDRPHFALLEAWIFMILLLRNHAIYAKALAEEYGEEEIHRINWERPVIAIAAPEQYLQYWERSDKTRGYYGLKHFDDCCRLFKTAYAIANENDLNLNIATVDVATLLFGNLESTEVTINHRSDITLKFKMKGSLAQAIPADELAEWSANSICLPWIDDEETGSRSRKVATSLRYSEKERRHQIQFKLESDYFSEQAKAQGRYGKYPVDYCLPDKHWEENIYGDIRQNAIDYFDKYGITWHALGKRHLLSSQTYCVNFLFPFTQDPGALKAVLNPIFKDIDVMLTIEDEYYVAFEWNGGENYLHEHGFGKRGEMATYPDAAVRYRKTDGKVKVILIEWKYTEKYTEQSKSKGKSGIRRMNTYREFFKSGDCPIQYNAFASNEDEAMEALFYEPFYQLLREQLLAHEIKKHVEDVDEAVVLHICPDENTDFIDTVTSPVLRERFPEKNVLDIWNELQKGSGTFVSTSQQSLLNAFTCRKNSKLAQWSGYINKRYL